MRLETISGRLYGIFQKAGREQRHRAALRACEIAVAQAGLHGTAIDTALKLIRGGENDATVRLEVEALSESFDREYFRLKDQGKPNTQPEVLRSFRKARAAAALALALSADSEQLHEALNEAAIASGDHEGMVTAVEQATLVRCSPQPVDNSQCCGHRPPP